jgi:hypothetical protein
MDGYYYLGVQYDITKQVVAEQEIKRLNDRLEILVKCFACVQVCSSLTDAANFHLRQISLTAPNSRAIRQTR